MSDSHDSFLADRLVWIPGVGPRKAEVLAGAGLCSVRDMLEHFPRRYLDRTSVTRIREIEEGCGEITVVGRITRCGLKGYSRRQRFEAELSDGTGTLNLVWFRRTSWVRKALETGDVIAASGAPRVYRGWQMQHPAFEKLLVDEDDTGSFEYNGQVVPIYPGTEELRKAWLDSRALQRIVSHILKDARLCFPEILPPDLVARLALVSHDRAMREVHIAESLEAVGLARRRLIFQELFLLQLMLALRHTERDERSGRPFGSEGDLLPRLLQDLPWPLTGAQQRVIDEILGDMRSPRPMNRLLQGDVGSGKTVVALAALLTAVSDGRQGAIMAPTEILAEQHFRNIDALCAPLGVRVTLLTGSRKGAKRQKALQEIAGGWTQIAVGTHALIQESVDFQDLGLVVIDEQHRFGVMQRASLRRKGEDLDTLVMTATPIPRTLAITAYGDMDLSLLDELPPGRKPVRTEWRPESKRGAILEWLREQVLEGAQAYLVYPLVEESEKLDLRAAEEAYEELRGGLLAEFDIGLLHGRMKAPEKDAVMQSFLKGEIQVLVSTTVIEVGVDNPRATVMIVDHAERFGLSQLHQLRGRVGRGSDRSWCILIAGRELSAEGRERLETMARTTDGFEIAETDLRMRGSGDFFGVRQSGVPLFKLADIVRDRETLLLARDEAFRLVEEDPRLQKHPLLRSWIDRYLDEALQRVAD